MKRAVYAGNLKIGGGAPVSIQSMTNTDTRDLSATLRQINELADAGCELVRVSVFDEACVRNVRSFVEGSRVPLCADIHFDHRLAIGAMENGIAKLRINPGNIGGADRVRLVADCAKRHRVPIRVGVNAGSLEKDVLNRFGGVTPQALCESALGHVRLLEAAGFEDIVISLKVSDARMTVETDRLIDRLCDYPLHVGVTEAGLPGQGTVKSAIAIGALLLDGIGDTIRVSLTGDPVREAYAAQDILKAIGLRGGIRFTSCPTCGRTRIDVERITRCLEEAFQEEARDVSIAVMGCVVNGPGEARDKDVALCGGDGCGALYIRGRFVKKLEGDLETEMLNAVRAFLNGEYDEN
ncbi:MAG: flavodoxin-dependent (E)-4-hydroxy-3-methylbut-2-enyl-diphosphate synthase [Clostridia bacterium]|nr:flavodoxin-dependent (E)-4-hydroxy-3-methylbut-2-enyl-diphosphate synthase [Clostridia bacterium]